MNEPKQKSLLELYRLLWEQIKDKPRLHAGLCDFVSDLRWEDKITNNESSSIKDHIRLNMPVRYLENGWTSCFGWEANKQGTSDRKSFVQRMIKELENDK